MRAWAASTAGTVGFRTCRRKRMTSSRMTSGPDDSDPDDSSQASARARPCNTVANPPALVPINGAGCYPMGPHVLHRDPHIPDRDVAIVAGDQTMRAGRHRAVRAGPGQLTVAEREHCSPASSGVPLLHRPVPEDMALTLRTEAFE